MARPEPLRGDRPGMPAQQRQAHRLDALNARLSDIHQSRGNNVGNNAVRNASQVKASAKKTTAMSDSQQRYLPHFNNGLEPNVHMNWKQSTKKAEKCDICDVQAKGRETHQRCADCHHVICRACCEAGGVARFTGHAWVDPNSLCWGTSLWSDEEMEYKPAKSRKATAAKRTVQRKQGPRSGPASGRGRGRGYGYGYGNGNRNGNRRVVPSLEDEPFDVHSNQDEEADYPMEDLVYGPSKSRKPRKSVPEAPRAKAQAPVVSSDDDFVPTPLPDYSSDEEAMPRKRVRLSGDSPSPEPQPQPWPRSLQRDASTPQLALGLANSRPVRASAIQTYEKMQRTQVVHDAPAARAIARRTPPRDSPTASSSKQKRSQGRNPAVVSSTKKASSSARGPSAYSPDAHPRNPFAPNPPRANVTQTEAIESPETAGRVQRSNAAKRQHGGNIRVPVQRQNLKPHNEDAFAASIKNDEALPELSDADHEHSDSLMSPSVSRALAPGSRANRNIDEEYDTDDQASVWSDGGKNNIAGDGCVTAASGDLEGAQGDIDSDGSEPVAAGGLDPSPSDEPLDVNNWPDTDHEYEIGFRVKRHLCNPDDKENIPPKEEILLNSVSRFWFGSKSSRAARELDELKAIMMLRFHLLFTADELQLDKYGFDRLNQWLMVTQLDIQETRRYPVPEIIAVKAESIGSVKVPNSDRELSGEDIRAANLLLNLRYSG
ncbi:hypothetical protein C8034_v002348 [Colletotrichum sidae]|nr:hypothetical protein C8034_v002348 [Colletotrichum sidae]